MDHSPSTVSSITKPVPLRVGLFLLFAQGVALIGLALFLVWLSFTMEQASISVGLAESLIAGGVAALLIGAGVSMGKGRPGMRGIAIFLQLLILVTGYYLAQADEWWSAATAWALGLVTILLLVTKSSREALGIGV